MKCFRLVCLSLNTCLLGCVSIDHLPLRQGVVGANSAFERNTISRVLSGRTPSEVAVAKLSGGSVVDLVMTSWDQNSGEKRTGIEEGKVSILYGADGKGRTWSTKDEYDVGLGASGIAIADFDGDGSLDLAIAATNGVTGYGQQTGLPGQVWIYYGNGHGGFGQPRIERSPVPFPETICVGDINGDNYPDIIIGSRSTKGVGILFGGSNGAFRSSTVRLRGTSQSIALGRFRDGKNLDVAVLGQKDLVDATDLNLSLLILDGSENFSEIRLPLNEIKSNVSEALAVGDFNRDGLDDLIVTTRETLLVYGSHAGQVPTIASVYRGHFAGGALRVADFDRDGLLDILVPIAPHGLCILFGDVDGRFGSRLNLLALDSFKLFGDQDMAMTLSRNRIVTAVSDIDGDGYPDILVVGNSEVLVPTQSVGSSEMGQSGGTAVLIYRNRLKR